MFDIGAPEFILLVVLAIIMFGPDKIPDFARKAARVLHFLRGIANNATSQLKAELGPEYADLTAADLNPKTFITKHLLGDIQEELDDIKTDLADIKDELNEDSNLVNSTVADVSADLGAATTVDSSWSEPAVVGAPFDTEAT